MSRVLEFSDGAERGDLSWWSGYSGDTGTEATATNCIHGSYCYKFISLGFSSLPTGTKVITTALSEFYMRCYVYPVDDFRIAIKNGTTTLLTLTTNTSLFRFDITDATTGNTGNNSLELNSWQCVELHYKISDTVGEITVRIDGVEVFTFLGDTKPGADSTANTFVFYGTYLTSFYVDDFALDTATWCGLGYYVALTPNAAGDVTQWTPTGAANYQNVSIPANDATYNTGATGQIDNYNMTTFTVGQSTVERVIPFARLSNPVGGNANFGLKTGGTNYTTSVVAPVSLAWLTGAEYAVSPKTSLAWTQTDINNIQFTAEMP